MKIVLFLLSLLISAAVLANFASQLVQSHSPQLSAQLNPLNSSARLAAAEKRFVADGNHDLDKIDRELQSAIRTSAIDARGFSLLGDVRAEQQRNGNAEALYDFALAQSGTDFRGLLRKLEIQFNARNAEKAAFFAKLLMMRWPLQSAQYMPIVVRLIDLPGGDVAVSRSFADQPRLIMRISQGLRSDPALLGRAASLVHQLAKDKPALMASEVERTMTTLLANNRSDEAYRLFQFTLSSEDRKLAGYLFNSEFDADPAKRPFDWNIRNQSGVEFSFETSEPTGVQSKAPNRYLKMNFMDSPVRFSNVSQISRLPPGAYTLQISTEGEAMKLPKPLYAIMRCKTGVGGELARLEFPLGTFKVTSLQANFSVLPGKCPLQEIALTNLTRTLDWNHRYSGTLKVFNISVSRASP